MSKQHYRSLLAAVFIATLIAVASLMTGGLNATDQQAVATIEDNEPMYDRWIDPVLQPPTAITEAALFAIQAGIAALVFTHYLQRLTETDQSETDASDA
jgi:cobalt/nickel transport protein